MSRREPLQVKLSPTTRLADSDSRRHELPGNKLLDSRVNYGQSSTERNETKRVIIERRRFTAWHSSSRRRYE